MPAFPPRLHCLHARDNPRIAVIIRSGPSKSVCTILWNRRNDTFQLGQWMRGRIYEGCYYDWHQLLDAQGNVLSDHPEWQWAELDRQRLVWAEAGKLFAGKTNARGLKSRKELHDFSAMRFEAIEAPY